MRRFTADVIVGFPGETHAEFEETVELCRRLRFASLHVFPYSVRPGTSAAHFDGRVGHRTKAERVDRLLRLGRSLGMEFRRGLMGDGPTGAVGETGRARRLRAAILDRPDGQLRQGNRQQRKDPRQSEFTWARLGRQEEGLVRAQVL